jgi:glycosyltransferase involved in cell wall biosynthesis
MPPDILAIVTARNEGERIGATLGALALAFPGAEVWVADDGSTDQTAAIAAGAGAHVVRGGRPVGKGGAATAAARDALGHARATPAGRDGSSIFVFCDGDLGASARSLDRLAAAIGAGGADIAVAVFATRVGGGIGLVVRLARRVIRRRCGLDVRAPISGQRALSQAALADVLPFAPGYGMEVGMTIDAVRAGLRVTEIELDLTHRATGRTPAGFAHRARQLLDILRAQALRA